MDHRKAFVDGAKFWMWRTTGATAFASEEDEMEREANTRYGLPPYKQGWDNADAYGNMDVTFNAQDRLLFLRCEKRAAEKYDEGCYDLTPLFKAPEWTSVNAELPAEYQEVLCYHQGAIKRGCWFEHRTAGRRWCIEGTTGPQMSAPTHWIHMPPAPSNVELTGAKQRAGKPE